MSAKDIFHDTVKNALVKQGWRITHDPLFFKWGKRRVFIDLGAEQVVAAERDGEKIAVEIKSFISDSAMADLHNAIGQFVLYHDLLARREPDRMLYLAIPESAFALLFENGEIGEVLLEEERVRLLVFSPDTEEIARWIP